MGHLQVDVVGFVHVGELTQLKLLLEERLLRDLFHEVGPDEVLLELVLVPGVVLPRDALRPRPSPDACRA